MLLLNSSQNAYFFMFLRFGFLTLMAITVFFLILTRSSHPQVRNLTLLRIITGCALLAILIYQARWQLAGFNHPEFVSFQRRYNPRQDNISKQVQRGSIKDINGEILASSDGSALWQRKYTLDADAAHIVGYYHPLYGLSGVEKAANRILSGSAFQTKREREQFGKNLLDHKTATGLDVKLTIDARLQRKAAALMNGKIGAAIILKPGDGAIIAMVSAPSFNPHEPGFAAKDNIKTPMLNRATQGLYPAGSTFKILVATMAVEQSKNPVLYCQASGFAATPGAKPIRDSEAIIAEREGRYWSGWGRIGLEEAFAHSSNVYFAQLGLQCRANALIAIGEATHINERIVYFKGNDTLQTRRGNLPSVSDSNKRAITQLSIGQGALLVTPMHVALFTAAIAAEGEWWNPRLLAETEPQLVNRIASRRAASTVKGYMRKAVTSGTARGINIAGLSVCGKTGTAEVPGGADHSWFTCFAPEQKPELVVTVLVERGGYGARSALPIARALLEEASALGLLNPDVAANRPTAKPDGGTP